MSATANKQVLQHAFAGLAAGDGSAFVACLADTARWTIIGTTRFSRVFDGKAAVVGELLTPVFKLFPGGFRITAERFVAEDDHVVVQARGNAATRDGKRYDNTYCFVIRMAKGRVESVTEYLDTALVDAVFGKA